MRHWSPMRWVVLGLQGSELRIQKVRAFGKMSRFRPFGFALCSENRNSEPAASGKQHAATRTTEKISRDFRRKLIEITCTHSCHSRHFEFSRERHGGWGSPPYTLPTETDRDPHQSSRRRKTPIFLGKNGANRNSTEMLYTPAVVWSAKNRV